MLIELYGLHGRGVATACKILADACASSNFHVQAMVKEDDEGYKSAFIKFDNVLADKTFQGPDFIIFMDDIDIKSKSLKEKSIVVHNSKQRIENALYKKKKIKSHYVDAFSISLKPNIVMLGALSKLCSKISATSVKAVLKNYKISAQDFEEGYRGVK
ncbi:MAG: hypothetical protein HY513_03965 [Candidatus Aenigmarchaeota archaeon]|nr:hypothetical protein [Candidatus Aenigmarchaeota archaeon]